MPQKPGASRSDLNLQWRHSSHQAMLYTLPQGIRVTRLAYALHMVVVRDARRPDTSKTSRRQCLVLDDVTGIWVPCKVRRRVVSIR